MYHLHPTGPPLTYFDMLPSASMQSRAAHGLPKGMPEVYVTPLMPMASTLPHVRKVLGCKIMPDQVKVARAPAVGPTYGLQAHQGNGRNQHIGLAYTKPIDLPLMPQASSVYAGLNNEIPLPP
jgi:hypothetical protein